MLGKHVLTDLESLNIKVLDFCCSWYSYCKGFFLFCYFLMKNYMRLVEVRSTGFQNHSKDWMEIIFNDIPGDLVKPIPLSQTSFLGHYSETWEATVQVFRNFLIKFSASAKETRTYFVIRGDPELGRIQQVLPDPRGSDPFWFLNSPFSFLTLKLTWIAVDLVALEERFILLGNETFLCSLLVAVFCPLTVTYLLFHQILTCWAQNCSLKNLIMTFQKKKKKVPKWYVMLEKIGPYYKRAHSATMLRCMHTIR